MVIKLKSAFVKKKFEYLVSVGVSKFVFDRLVRVLVFNWERVRVTLVSSPRLSLSAVFESTSVFHMNARQIIAWSSTQSSDFRVSRTKISDIISAV